MGKWSSRQNVNKGIQSVRSETIRTEGTKEMIKICFEETVQQRLERSNGRRGKKLIVFFSDFFRLGVLLDFWFHLAFWTFGLLISFGFVNCWIGQLTAWGRLASWLAAHCRVLGSRQTPACLSQTFWCNKSTLLHESSLEAGGQQTSTNKQTNKQMFLNKYKSTITNVERQLHKSRPEASPKVLLHKSIVCKNART